MTFNLTEWSLKSRLWVIIGTVAAAVLGIYSIMNLSIDAVPDITNVQVMINTKTGPLTPEEIETSVTFPIESELSGLQEVEEIRSLSKYGLSQVIVVFKDGMDLYFARQLISERLQGISDQLPPGLTPQMGPVSTGLGEVFMYVVLAKPGSALEKKPEKERLLYLRTIQDWKIKPIMKTIAGVAEIDSSGGFEKAVTIRMNPVKMQQYGISVQKVEESLADAGVNRGGGFLEYNKKRILVRSQGRFTSLEHIRNIPIRIYALGSPVQLKDIAAVSMEGLPRLGAATYEGEETVLGTVLMRIGENSRTVAQQCEETIKNLRLPDDVKIEVLYTRSFLVNQTVKTVGINLFEGAVLVIAILLIILGNLRAAIIVSLAIPLSMMVSITGMVQSKISANLMSLGAIDFGLLVDASVVIIENIVRKMEQHRGSLNQKEKFALIVESTREVSSPVISGLFIIMIVYVPILSLTGIEGKMFRPMAITVLYALLASLVVALVLMPVLAYLFLNKSKHHKESLFFHYAEQLYKPILLFSLTKRKYMLTGAVLFMTISFFLFTRLGSNFIPQLDEGDLIAGLVRNADISLDDSIDIQKKSDRIIGKFKEVEHVFSRTGTPASATDPMPINFSDTFIILKKNKDEWPGEKNGKRRSKAEVFEDISKAIDRDAPGQEISPTQPIEMRFNEMLEGSRADVTLRIFGPDLNELIELVNRAQVILKKIDGVDKVGMDELTALRKSPVMNFKLDHSSLSRYGIHIQDANMAFETSMAGSTLSNFYEADIRYPIVIRMDDKFRNDIRAFQKIPVELPGGGIIEIGQLGKVQLEDQITTISRYNARRYASVAVFLKDRDIESFVKEAKSKIETELNHPKNVTLEWGGQFKNLAKARLRMILIAPIMLSVIFLILMRIFESLKQTLLIFATVPFAVTGGIFLLYIRGIPFSISAAVGFIALTGIAILNGTVLVSFFNQLRENGMETQKAVLEGAMIRLRPVLMTALVASLGFIPMAFNTGAGAEVQRPLATVVIGGLISSTILTLLLLPSLYVFFERTTLKIKKS